MTRQEAELIVGTLVVAWPWASWPDGTVALYRHLFEAMEHVDIAQKIVENAKDTLERPPSIATLREQYEARAKVRDWQPPDRREELPAGDQSLESIRDVLEGSEIGRWLLERRDVDKDAAWRSTPSTPAFSPHDLRCRRPRSGTSTPGPTDLPRRFSLVVLDQLAGSTDRLTGPPRHRSRRHDLRSAQTTSGTHEIRYEVRGHWGQLRWFG